MATTTSGFRQSRLDSVLCCLQHTLIVHKRASKLAASIVAPLRKTKPELSPHLLLISFRGYCIQNQLRSWEWSKKRERFIFVCICVLTLGVLTSRSARRIIIHSVLWQARLWLTTGVAESHETLVLFEGCFLTGLEKICALPVAVLGKAEDVFAWLWLNLSWRTWLHRSLEKTYGFFLKKPRVWNLRVYFFFTLAS